MLVSSVVVFTVGGNIGHCFQGPVCTSKYRKGDFCKQKIAIKWGKFHRKNGGWCPLLVMMLGNAFRVQCTFPSMESVAMLNEKAIKCGKIMATKGDGAHCW